MKSTQLKLPPMFHSQPQGIGQTVLAGLAGLSGSALTFTATLIGDVEIAIRVAAGVLGVVVSLLMIIKIAIDIKKSLKK